MKFEMIGHVHPAINPTVKTSHSGGGFVENVIGLINVCNRLLGSLKDMSCR